MRLLNRACGSIASAVLLVGLGGDVRLSNMPDFLSQKSLQQLYRPLFALIRKSSRL
jgi:hypothetical protein